MPRARLLAALRRPRGARRPAAGAPPPGPRFPLLFGGASLPPWPAPRRGCSRWCRRPAFPAPPAVLR
ncbi:PE family protein, partial [Mycobacterium tuberculosis]